MAEKKTGQARMLARAVEAPANAKRCSAGKAGGLAREQGQQQPETEQSHR